MRYKNKIPLGRLFGIPIGLDYSWFLIFTLVTWTLAVGYYPAEFKGWVTTLYWGMGAVTALMLFVSVLLHELGHAVVAMRYDIPVRSITLFAFGGVAQIGTEPPSPRSEFLIAIAGPIVSFALALLFGVLEPVFSGVAPLVAVLKYLALINGVLAVFNLIPGFPLDGGRVFRAVVWGITHDLRRATVIAANVGRFIGFLFILLGVWRLFAGNLFNGLWIAFIGWFLESAASAQVQQQRLHELLAGHHVSEAMQRGYPSVPAGITLQKTVDQHILGEGQHSFAVEQDGAFLGLLTLQRIKHVPREQWPTTTAEGAMTPVAELKRTRPEMEIWAAMEEMDRAGVSHFPVMDNGHLLGMFTREEVIRYLRTLQELGVRRRSVHRRHLQLRIRPSETSTNETDVP